MSSNRVAPSQPQKTQDSTEKDKNVYVRAEGRSSMTNIKAPTTRNRRGSVQSVKSLASMASVPSFFSVDGLRLLSFNNERQSIIGSSGSENVDAHAFLPLETDNPWEVSSDAPMHVIEVKNGKNNERKVRFF